ncbi:MAG: DUF2437 domain-containing protein, partial [Acidimicrobiales bacterium]
MRVGRALVDGMRTAGVIDGTVFRPVVGDPFSELQVSDTTYDLDGVTLLSPSVPRILLMVLGGFPQPGVPPPTRGEEPRLSAKVNPMVPGDGSAILVPDFVEGDLWAEVELAVVVGREL